MIIVMSLIIGTIRLAMMLLALPLRLIMVMILVAWDDAGVLLSKSINNLEKYLE